MARIIAAGGAGAVIYYIWGMLTWMALPLHTPTIAGLPHEAEVIESLRAKDLESGVYVAPFTTNAADMGDPESDFMKAHTQGPIFSIYYHKNGSVPMNGGMLGSGFVLDLLGGILAAYLLSCVGPRCASFACRVGFVASLGFFVALMGHFAYWNWMYFPLDYTLAFVVDVTVGWALAGVAIAWIVPAPESAAAAPRSVAAAPEPAAPKPTSTAPPPPVRNDAITLLATLQREARLIDIVQEPLDGYSDAQVGAAARDVLRDARGVLERLFDLAPVVDAEEGAQVDIPQGAEAAAYQVHGSTDRQQGQLVHPGWKAQKCVLPQWTGSSEGALVITPAELEAKES